MEDDMAEAVGGNDNGLPWNNDVENDSDDEEQVYDDEELPIFDEQLLLRIQQNDPSITTVAFTFGDGGYATTLDWKRHADALSKNTQIKTLYLWGPSEDEVVQIDDATRDNLKEFCKGLARNRSINVLSLDRGELDENVIIPIPNLVPFIEHNLNLHRLSISCYIDNESKQLLISALAARRGDKKSLQEVDFAGCYLEDKNAGELLNALKGHNELRRLGLCVNLIGLRGCVATCNLMLNSQVKELLLTRNSLDDNCVKILTNALAKNYTLKHLDLGSNLVITSTGWQTFAASLQRPNLALEYLCLAENNIDAQAAVALSGSLFENKTLKILILRGNSIGSVGLRAISSLIQRSNSSLEELNVDRTDIDDEGVIALARSLPSNSLRTLYINDNEFVTPAGWQALLNTLFREGSMIKSLSIGSNDTEDGVPIALANCLASNKTLESLTLGDQFKFTKASTLAFSRLLCDKTSIMSTYLSNHSFCNMVWVPPSDMRPYLALNKIKNKSKVARLKIIQHHFVIDDGINIQEFLGIELKVMPHAVEWIGRDTQDTSLLYELVKNMPALFGPDHNDLAVSAKRKWLW